MKNVILSLFAVLVAVPAAAVPDVVTWAARVENDAGPFDGTVSIDFALFDAANGGTAVWNESVASLVVVDGDAVHDLGSIQPLDDSVLGRSDLFLSVTMNGETLSPRAALRAVPFALKAREAESLAGLSADDVATDDEVSAAVAARVVSFAELAGVPAGFADGVDADTVATAAAAGGLKAVNNAFAIDDNGVTLARMADNAVGSAEIVDGSVAGADIKDASVATAELVDGAVTSVKIADGTITAADIAPNSIGIGQIAGENLVAERPGVCGGGLTSQGVTQEVNQLTTTTTLVCETVACVTNASQPRYRGCDNSCSAFLTPQTCTFRNVSNILSPDPTTDTDFFVGRVF